MPAPMMTTFFGSPVRGPRPSAGVAVVSGSIGPRCGGGAGRVRSSGAWADESVMRRSILAPDAAETDAEVRRIPMLERIEGFGDETVALRGIGTVTA